MSGGMDNPPETCHAPRPCGCWRCSKGTTAPQASRTNHAVNVDHVHSVNRLAKEVAHEITEALFVLDPEDPSFGILTKFGAECVNTVRALRKIKVDGNG